MSRKLSRHLLAFAFGASLTAGASVAAAEDLLVHDYQANTAAVGGLIEPIQPFLGTTAGSTTAIIQLGVGNASTVATHGSGNLALVQQAGNNNRAVQAINGDSSALLLVQGGSNNTVFQASHGNNNFQLVGVSGTDNQVAYVQAGDNLAGALDVRDSKNSTVLAFQTPQSGQYLMPSGLRGLENKTVVVVPGRMYVFPKR